MHINLNDKPFDTIETQLLRFMSSSQSSDLLVLEFRLQAKKGLHLSTL